MIFTITITIIVKRKEREQMFKVLDVHLFQYLESEIKSDMDNEMIRDTLTRTSPCFMVSTENDVCTFDNADIMLMNTSKFR